MHFALTLEIKGFSRFAHVILVLHLTGILLDKLSAACFYLKIQLKNFRMYVNATCKML